MSNTIFLFLRVMDYGGQERFVSRLSEMLGNEYNVYVVLFDSSIINYPIHGEVLDLKAGDFTANFFKKVAMTIRLCAKLRKEIKRYRPIACISFGIGPDIINILSKRRGINVVTSIRGYGTVEHMVKKRIVRFLYPRSDKVICVSKVIKEKLKKDLPSLANKLEVLYNGYDCAQIYSASQQYCPDSLKGIDGPKLVSVGTLRPEKGYWHMIKAVWIIKKSYPNIRLTIVGEDYQLYGSHLKELISRLDLQSNVVLEGFNNNPYVYVANSDVYVLSSVREGFPNALVEAMACGKPVVAVDCLTGPREILSELPYEEGVTQIEQAEYGILVPNLSLEEDFTCNIPEEDKILAQAINSLLEDPALRQKYAAKAMSRAQFFSYSSCRNRLIEILERT